MYAHYRIFINYRRIHWTSVAVRQFSLVTCSWSNPLLIRHAKHCCSCLNIFHHLPVVRRTFKTLWLRPWLWFDAHCRLTECPINRPLARSVVLLFFSRHLSRAASRHFVSIVRRAVASSRYDVHKAVVPEQCMFNIRQESLRTWPCKRHALMPCVRRVGLMKMSAATFFIRPTVRCRMLSTGRNGFNGCLRLIFDCISLFTASYAN